MIGFIRAKIKRRDGGFNEASLQWRCAMRDVDTLEERVLKCRQATARKGSPARDVQYSRKLPDGRTETVLAPEKAREPVRVDPVKALHSLADAVKAAMRGDAR